MFSATKASATQIQAGIIWGCLPAMKAFEWKNAIFAHASHACFIKLLRSEHDIILASYAGRAINFSLSSLEDSDFSYLLIARRFLLEEDEQFCSHPELFCMRQAGKKVQAPGKHFYGG